jgi:hypothetical protein
MLERQRQLRGSGHSGPVNTASPGMQRIVCALRRRDDTHPNEHPTGHRAPTQKAPPREIPGQGLEEVYAA